MRVLVFGSNSIQVDSISRGLMQFADVHEVKGKWRAIRTRGRIVYRPMEFLYQILRVFKIIHDFRADIILVMDNVEAVIAVVAAKLSRKPCVVQFGGYNLITYSSSALQSLLGLFFTHLVLKLVSGGICVNKDLQAMVRKAGVKSTTLIPVPLDLSDFEKANGERCKKCIITVARLVPIKGIDYLIRAMLVVKDGTMIIVGDGVERERLEALANNLDLGERVVFTGNIAHHEVWNYLQKAAVFVLPSLSEGLGRALLEAMTCGLPIVATRVGGIPELIVHNVNGFLVRAGDEKALAEAIMMILDDNELQKRMGIENIKRSQKYLLPSICSRIYDYLRLTFIQ